MTEAPATKTYVTFQLSEQERAFAFAVMMSTAYDGPQALVHGEICQDLAFQDWIERNYRESQKPQGEQKPVNPFDQPKARAKWRLRPEALARLEAATLEHKTVPAMALIKYSLLRTLRDALAAEPQPAD